MTDSHSTARAAADKPAKPYPEFPLFPHVTGRGAKNIRGKLHYFGPWADPDGALTKYLAEKDDLRALHIEGRKGLGFYTLRHTFRTVADEAKDQPAADFLMGHEVPHRSTMYRETISDARLKAVTEHVRHWLFDEKTQPESGKEAGTSGPGGRVIGRSPDQRD